MAVGQSSAPGVILFGLGRPEVLLHLRDARLGCELDAARKPWPGKPLARHRLCFRWQRYGAIEFHELATVKDKLEAPTDVVQIHPAWGGGLLVAVGAAKE